MPALPYESRFQRVDQEFVTTSFPSSKHDQFVVSGIAPIQLPARKSTLSETIRQRPMRAGCWRFLHANDDKVTACGFRNDVRSRKVGFRPTVWLFREFSVRIINVNGHLDPRRMISLSSMLSSIGGRTIKFSGSLLTVIDRRQNGGRLIGTRYFAWQRCHSFTVMLFKCVPKLRRARISVDACSSSIMRCSASKRSLLNG